MNRYYIPQHVYFASDAGAVVFMDLVSDRYSMFVGAKARTFLAMLQITPSSLQELSLRDAESCDPDLRQEVLSDLLENGLLTDAPDHATSARPPLMLPEFNLLEASDAQRERVRMRDIWRFVTSCIVSIYKLRFTSLNETIDCIKRRKGSVGNAESASLPDLRHLVALYRTLRPLFPHDFLCMFDSLSLVEFLARYHHYPDIIFAVRLDPWSAHCWVQHSAVALNEDVEETRAYLPIMAA
jgi:hypothetical protein